MAMKEQELPNNTTAEQALLGALLIDPDAIHRVSAIVQAGDFYQEHHSWLYAAILSLANHDTPPDFVNVCDLLERRDQLQGIGGPAGIVRFMETMPNSLHAEHYARLVANYATRRRLIDAAGAIARAAYDTNNGDPLSEAHKALLNIGTNGSGLRSAQAVAGALYDRIEQWTANPLMPGQVRGLSAEVREKFLRHRPETLGQAGRIPGVTPAALSLLLIHLRRKSA